MKNPRIMAHFIPYFPNRALSIVIALTMLKQGAEYLEVQFPFSDPSADGPLIEKACHSAISQGFRVNAGFEFIHELYEKSEELREGTAKVFLMTYASIPFVRGIPRFLADAKKVHVSGIIIPDLPIDSNEGLLSATQKEGIELIPVVAVNAPRKRISMIIKHQPEYLYCVLRKGITGEKTELGSKNIAFLNALNSKQCPKILAGFGIREYFQIHALPDHVHAAVAGSTFIQAVSEIPHGACNAQSVTEAIRSAMNKLMRKY